MIRDDNRVPMLGAVLNTDGVTVGPVMVRTDHRLMVDDGDTGTDYPTTTAQRDDNRVPTLWATSSADGVTPVSIYRDLNGRLLVQST